MDQTFAMRIFSHVVEEGSFSKAALRVGITQSSASRYISALEDELGAKLLQRSTRQLNLTEAGQLYYQRVRQIIEDLDNARLAVKDLNATPSGLLRVTAPAAFGLRHIAPFLSEFHVQYPKINIGLSLSDGVEDIIAAGFDLAIRFGALNDSSLIATQLATSHSAVCASAGYLKQAVELQSPQQLNAHNCLTFRTSPGSNMWHFNAADAPVSVAVSGSLYADNGDALLNAALNGLGIVQLPYWMLDDYINDGDLVAILTDYELLPDVTPIHAVYAHKQYMAAKIRVFIDFLKIKYLHKKW